MKFAVLYAGPYRGTSEILNNHINTFGKDVDIYVSCFEHYLDDWKTSGWAIKEYYITPSINFNETNWSKQRNDAPGQSGFWQFWNLKNVIDNVPKKYDYYIKCRNDIVFENSFQFDKSLIQKNTLYSPNNSFHRTDWDVDKWVNDEFYISCENTMDIISKFVTNFYEKERHSLNQAAPYIGSNEASLRIWLRENNIDVEKIYDFRYKKNNNGVIVPSGYSGFQLEKI
jgi:hypothetical protein